MNALSSCVLGALAGCVIGAFLTNSALGGFVGLVGGALLGTMGTLTPRR